jgi:hypothetical protein
MPRKRLTFALLLLFIAAGMASAQYTDTMFYGNTRALISLYVWGYISGTNGYGDIGKYQRFDYSAFDDRYLVGARVYFGFKRIVDKPDTVWLVSRRVGENGGPGAIVDSVAMTTDKLDTTGKGNTIYFKKPLKVLGRGFEADTFFVGIQWKYWNEAQSDTFALFCDPDGQGELQQRVWERIDYSGAYVMWPWINSPDANFEWNVDSDLWITALLSPTATAVPPSGAAPPSFGLEQNYPNPFNPATDIGFQIASAGSVRLSVFDVLGREVALLVNERKEPGAYRVRFEAGDLPNGVYFYRLTTNGGSLTKKMVLAR